MNSAHDVVVAIVGCSPAQTTSLSSVVDSDDRPSVGSENLALLCIGICLGCEWIDVVVSTRLPRDDIIVLADITSERASGSSE